MSRLHKKCFAVSMGMHLLLVAILVLGTAFFLDRPKPKRPQPLNFVSSQVVENALNPTPPPVTPPAVTPPPVRPPAVVAPPKQVRPPAIRKTVRPPRHHIKKAAPKQVTPKKTTSPRTIKIDLSKAVTRNVVGKARPKTTLEKKTSPNIAKSMANIRQKLSPSMKIQSIGTASVVFDKYKLYVRNAYYNAWLVPGELTGVVRPVEVRVTIGRDGRVLSARITRRAANAKLDASVQRALKRVKHIGHPFPAGAREKQRTFIIDFDLRARRGVG